MAAFWEFLTALYQSATQAALLLVPVTFLSIAERRLARLGGLARSALIGTIFGGSALIGIAEPVPAGSIVSLDTGLIAISLAQSLGGPLSTIIAGLIELIDRIQRDGGVLAPPIGGILLGGMAAILADRALRRHGPACWQTLLITGLAAGTAAILPPLRQATDLEAALDLGVVPLVTGLGTSLVGLLIVRERLLRDIRRELQRQAAGLRSSEERLRFLSDIATQVIFVHDGRVVTDCNEAIEGLIGIPRADIIGMRLADLLVPEDRAISHDAIVEDRREPFVVRVRHRDGSVRRVEIRARRVSRLGAMARIASITDVTELLAARDTLSRANEELEAKVAERTGHLEHEIAEREAAENRARQAERLLREIIDQTPVGIALYDAQEALQFHNATMARMFGTSPDHDPVGMKLRDAVRHNVARHAVGNEERDAMTDRIVAQIRDPEAAPFDAELKDGRILQNRAVLLADGRILCILLDVTEARKRESRTREVLDGIADWIWEIDRDTRLTYVSERFFEKFGFRKEEVLGQPIALFLPRPSADPRHRRESEVLLAAIMAMKPFRDLTSTLRRPGGEIITTRVSAVPMFDGDQLIGMRGASTDITELREAQESLAQVEKMAALGALVAGLAHEINTPIGVGLTGATALARRARDIDSLLRDGRLRRSDLDHFLADALSATEIVELNLVRAAELISSFKKISVDQTSDERREIDLGAYVNTVLVSLTPETRRSGHTIQVDIPPGLILDTVPGAISQIVTNLVMNSLIHAFPDGRVGFMSISAKRRRNGVDLVFADNGVGADAETVRRMYEPFFTTKRGSGGSGLGMSVVYTLVTDRLGGRIASSSTPGCGVEHRLWLPGAVSEPGQKR